MGKKFVSLLTHSVSLLDGTVIPPSGGKAFMEFSYGDPDADGIMDTRLVAVRGVPDPSRDVVYVTSSLLASYLCRPDVVSPACGHRSKRYNMDGFRFGAKVLAVPGWCRFYKQV